MTWCENLTVLVDVRSLLLVVLFVVIMTTLLVTPVVAWAYRRGWGDRDDDAKREAADMRPVAPDPLHLPTPAAVVAAERAAGLEEEVEWRTPGELSEMGIRRMEQRDRWTPPDHLTRDQAERQTVLGLAYESETR